ncbi:MAG: beta-lactamase family protein [Clostridia bacterium]|nr:beta-lactamase family protein [Clostridia bacterium]
MYDFTRVNQYLDHVHTDLGAPCCDAQVCYHGEPVYRYITGVADKQNGIAASDKTLYFLYSCTKPVTAAAALQLVEQGRIGLDDELSRYLPEFKDAFTLVDGKPQRVSRPITIRHLLTMSSGYNYALDSEPIRAAREQFGPQATTRQMISAYAEMPLLFEPGTRWEYGVSLDIMATVIEEVSQMRYGEYLRKNIFDVLGMDADIGFDLTEEQLTRVADQYRIVDSGPLRDEPKSIGAFRLSPRFESGGAGLFASLNNYGKFAAAMSCGGALPGAGRILKPETVRLMGTEQLSGHLSNPTFDFGEWHVGYGYGLGVRTLVDRSAGQRSALGEMGWDGAASAYILMDAAQEVSIVYAQHTLNWPARFANVHTPLRDLVYDCLGL